MTVREHLEEIERRVLEPGACLAAGSQGRLRPEPESDARTCFMRDRDRIIHSKAFRRLKHKTQVFLSPEGDHYRTRLTHTLEVSQISRTIARGLGLNEDLDRGHRPGTRPGAHRLWPRRGAGAGRGVPRRVPRTTSRACGWWTGWKTAAPG